MLCSPTMREISLLLLIAPIAHASSLLHPRQMEVMGYPIYHNGPYPFIACTESQGQILMDLFNRAGNILSNQVIPSLSNYAQDPTQDAFRTFFSTNSRATVQEVFQKFVDRPQYVTLGTSKYAPNIICLNNDHTPQQLQGPKARCDAQDAPYGLTHGIVPRYSAPNRDSSVSSNTFPGKIVCVNTNLLPLQSRRGRISLPALLHRLESLSGPW